MKKLHPDQRSDDEFDDEEEDELNLVYSDIEPDEDKNDNEEIDPRWKDLLDLKSNKK